MTYSWYNSDRNSLKALLDRLSFSSIRSYDADLNSLPTSKYIKTRVFAGMKQFVIRKTNHRYTLTLSTAMNGTKFTLCNPFLYKSVKEDFVLSATSNLVRFLDVCEQWLLINPPPTKRITTCTQGQILKSLFRSIFYIEFALLLTIRRSVGCGYNYNTM